MIVVSPQAEAMLLWGAAHLLQDHFVQSGVLQNAVDRQLLGSKRASPNSRLAEDWHRELDTAHSDRHKGHRLVNSVKNPNMEIVIHYLSATPHRHKAVI